MNRRPPAILLVALGGALGTLVRVVLLSEMETSLGTLLPTLLIDVAGAALAGAIFGYVHGPRGPAVPPIDAPLAPLAITGFCGGFTTFSGFGLHIAESLGDGAWTSASLGLCFAMLGVLAAARVGLAVGTRASPRW